MGGFRAHREYSRLAKRSQNMVAALKEVSEHLRRPSTPARVEALLRRTEAMLLAETQDWLMLMRFVRLRSGG